MTDSLASATPPAEPSPDAELTARVARALSGGYELEREMGRGGMGIVYRARDRRLKRPVAIKVLPPELAFRAEIRSRFLREAETAAQLTHPHIVPIYSVDEADGIVYFVMACVDGENLGRRLHERGPMPVRDVRRVLAEVADALAYAHARGVVHRDIKPDNILLDGDGDRAMVSDFGIARAIIEGSDARLTATGMAIGTPAYMSPEQSAGDREVDGRSDLYSLGVVAYQMLAGELPFQASSTPAMLVKHLSERPTPVAQRRPDTPPDIADVVMRLLEKDPEARLSGAEELEAVLLGQRAVAPPSYATTQPPRAAMAPLPPGPAAQPPAPYGNYAPPTERPLGAGAGRPALEGAYGLAAASAGGARAVEPRGAGATLDGTLDGAQPTAEEYGRWDAPPVRDFRKKLGWYAIVGGVLLFLSIFGNSDFAGFLGMWTVYIAYRYAKLWSDGYSWHDVLRQPKDRLLVDVAGEWADDVHAVFDQDKRAQVRERARQRRLRGGYGAPGFAYGGGGAGSVGAGAAGGGYALSAGPAPNADAAPDAAVMEALREALAERDEIVRALAAVPKGERERLGDVGTSARALGERAQALASTVAQCDRDASPGAAAVLESEIGRLEAEANPLDRAASDDRVKRLAYLKRQRRAVAGLARRRGEAATALEHCRDTLRAMRLDLARLRAGAASPAQVTTLAERAMGLAREVDVIVGAAGEVSRTTARDGRDGGRARGGDPAGPAGAPVPAR